MSDNLVEATKAVGSKMGKYWQELTVIVAAGVCLAVLTAGIQLWDMPDKFRDHLGVAEARYAERIAGDKAVSVDIKGVQSQVEALGDKVEEANERSENFQREQRDVNRKILESLGYIKGKVRNGGP